MKIKSEGLLDWQELQVHASDKITLHCLCEPTPSELIQSLRISLTILGFDAGGGDRVLLYRNELMYLKLGHFFPKTSLALSMLHSSKLRDEAVMDMVKRQSSPVEISHVQGANSVQLLCVSVHLL